MNNDNKDNQNPHKKEDSTKMNINKHNPTTIFNLPITFVEKNKLHILDEHILTDLELTNVVSPGSTTPTPTDSLNNVNEKSEKSEKSEEPVVKTMYDHIFNPKTIYGKHFLSNWATHYTSDVTFLKQTQTLIKHFSPPQSSEDEKVNANNTIDQYNDIHAIWNSIQNDKHFKDNSNKTICLNTRRSNINAYRLYQSMGYNHIAFIKNKYFLPTEDSIFMIKDLT